MFNRISGPAGDRACKVCKAEVSSQCVSGSPCPGYGKRDYCPPLIVLAAADFAYRSLLLSCPPQFGSFPGVQR